MNILLLSQFFSNTRGGGEYVFSMIAKILAKNNHKVWVITNQIKDEKYIEEENLKILFVPPLIKYQGGLPAGFYDNIQYVMHTVRKGLAVIRNEKIDMIHSNNFAPALAGSILSTITGKSHITTIHDVFSMCGKNYWKLWGEQSDVSKLNVLLAPFFEKMILNLKHVAIHTVSDTSKEDLVKFGAKKPIYVIPNTIEFGQIRPSKVQPYEFTFIGRLVFYKNLEVAIKAVGIVKKKFPDITLNIIGDGPHRKNLEKLVSDLKLENNVKFLGYLSEEQKIDKLSSSQALVFPSLCEGFGLVILEAFSLKKPVLVSDVPPLSKIVSNDVTGLVISPHDENAWATAMIGIITNQDNSFNMGHNGYAITIKQYNIENMQDKILHMYEDFLNK